MARTKHTARRSKRGTVSDGYDCPDCKKNRGDKFSIINEIWLNEEHADVEGKIAEFADLDTLYSISLVSQKMHRKVKVWLVKVINDHSGNAGKGPLPTHGWVPVQSGDKCIYSCLWGDIHRTPTIPLKPFTIYRHILDQRTPPSFQRIYGDLERVSLDGGSNGVKLIHPNPESNRYEHLIGLAASERVMTGGGHYRAEFCFAGKLRGIKFGIARPFPVCITKQVSMFICSSPFRWSCENNEDLPSMYPSRWKIGSPINVLLSRLVVGCVMVRAWEGDNVNPKRSCIRDGVDHSAIVRGGSIEFDLDLSDECNGTLGIVKSDGTCQNIVDGLTGDFVWVAILSCYSDDYSSYSTGIKNFRVI